MVNNSFKFVGFLMGWIRFSDQLDSHARVYSDGDWSFRSSRLRSILHPLLPGNYFSHANLICWIPASPEL